MRTWVLLAGVLFAVYGALRWLSTVVNVAPEAPTWSIGALVVGVVLIVVSFFIKEKKEA
jgi:peptidoglycan/LPS O-acetylase OafA/YrhL